MEFETVRGLLRASCACPAGRRRCALTIKKPSGMVFRVPCKGEAQGWVEQIVPYYFVNLCLGSKPPSQPHCEKVDYTKW